jgi:hypothetical protein
VHARVPPRTHMHAHAPVSKLACLRHFVLPLSLLRPLRTASDSPGVAKSSAYAQTQLSAFSGSLVQAGDRYSVVFFYAQVRAA